MNKKVTLELGLDELLHIERALDLYTRIGLFQFDKLDMCTSFDKYIKNGYKEVYKNQTENIKGSIGFGCDSYPSIFNKDIVGDDVRIVADMLQTIRHSRYLNRIETKEQTNRHYTNDEYEADVCRISGIKKPIIDIKIK